MKLNQKKNSIQQPISNIDPDLLYEEREVYYGIDLFARSPNRPTPEAIERAQFVDKTYHWKNAGIRSGD